MTLEFDPKAPLYADERAQRWVSLAGKAGVALTLATIVVAAWLLVRGPNASTQAIVLGMAAAWGVGGPMWFFSEYFFIYREFGASNSWELFKHGQQLSAAVWVALTASLAAFGTSDYAKVPGGSLRCELQTESSAAPCAGAPAKIFLSCGSRS